MDLRLSLVLLAFIGTTSFLVALPLDHDQDGLTTWDEWRAGSDSLDEDSDDDGIYDGWEVAWGMSPTMADGDGDGLEDGWELTARTDPFVADMDADGVLDGDERALVCVRRADCDGDGLADALEQAEYDPLDPDTFDAGLTDAVVRAFAEAGQPPSSDEDQDGIPDAWEAQDGLIAWGGFTPTPEATDLLVEYIHVQGPASGRFGLDFTPAYEAVAQMFLDRGIRLQWQETVVVTQEEHRPGFLDTDAVGYYSTVLESASASTNPFVTSIVLNPQQEQEDLAGDILGAAFLRSMIATVDYGAHTTVAFREVASEGLRYDGELQIKPVVESHIIGARLDQVRQLQQAGAIVSIGADEDGVFYVVPDDNVGPVTWKWRNDWFQDGPVVTTEDDRFIRFEATRATVDAPGLAATIAHELGHTLGLCHAHDFECYQQFPLDDALARHESTMSYGAPPDTLHFLDAEWQQVADYVTCPPQEPIRLVAEQAGDEAVLTAKYVTSFETALDLRACRDLEPLPATMPRGDAPLSVPAAAAPSPAPWVTLHATVSVVVALLVVRRPWG